MAQSKTTVVSELNAVSSKVTASPTVSTVQSIISQGVTFSSRKAIRKANFELCPGVDIAFNPTQYAACVAQAALEESSF